MTKRNDAGKPKLYLDNCCYGRPYDDQFQTRIRLEAQAKLAIQYMVEKGECLLVASSYLLYENGNWADETARAHTHDYIVSNMTVFVEGYGNASLENLIREIEGTGIKAMDAAHLASAIFSGCDRFITADDRVLKHGIDGIRTVDPAQFMTEERRGACTRMRR